MSQLFTILLKDIGLNRWPLACFNDRLFYSAIALAFVAWSVLWMTAVPTFRLEGQSIGFIIFFAVIWSPVLEEILFRGVIQGALLKKRWGKTRFLFLSHANWLSSAFFVLAHLLHQPILWALLVFGPSLVYGFFRDRYDNTYPSILLHAFYNGGFILINVLAQ